MASKTCRGTTVAGTPCRAAAGPTGLCFFHAHPEKVRQLGQDGGLKNRQKLPELVSRGPLTAADLQNILADAIQDVRSKKLAPRVASTIAQLCNTLNRISPAAELESRVTKLEQQLVQQQSASLDSSDWETTQSAPDGDDDVRQPAPEGTEPESKEG